VWGSHWVVSPNSAAHSIRLKTRYNAPISTRLGGGKAMQEIIMSQQEFGTQIIQHIEEMLARAEHDIHTGGQREEPYNKELENWLRVFTSANTAHLGHSGSHKR
jgi:hypothetical protein